MPQNKMTLRMQTLSEIKTHRIDSVSALVIPAQQSARHRKMSFEVELLAKALAAAVQREHKQTLDFPKGPVK